MTSCIDSRDAPGQRRLHDAWRVLEQSGWLAECEAEDRELLFGIAEVRQFDAGEFLYCAGDPADGVYGFVEGAVDIAIPRIDGEIFVFHRSGSGLWVGDMPLFAGRERLMSLQAVEGTVTVFLPKGRLLRLARTHPRIKDCFYRLTYENVALTVKLLGSLAVVGAENRVALRLLSLADAEETGQQVVRISQARLAQYVALSDQSVRRAVRKLEQAGLIEAGYGRYQIIDRQGLAALCGYAV